MYYYSLIILKLTLFVIQCDLFQNVINILGSILMLLSYFIFFSSSEDHVQQHLENHLKQAKEICSQQIQHSSGILQFITMVIQCLEVFNLKNKTFVMVNILSERYC